jgi:hypothetical protein
MLTRSPKEVMTMQSRHFLILVAALALAAASVLAAGCGGDSESPGVAQIGTNAADSDTSTDGSSNGGSEDDSDGKDPTAFSRCMRSHGVPNFPDPDSDGGIEVGPNSGIDPDSATFKAAERECQELLDIKPPTPAEQAEMQEQALRFAECMRSHGVPDFPDPVFSAGRGRITLPKGANPKSPQFRAAQEACERLLPGPEDKGTRTRRGPGS